MKLINIPRFSVLVMAKLYGRGRQPFDTAGPKSSSIIGRGPLIRFPLNLDEIIHKTVFYLLTKNKTEIQLLLKQTALWQTSTTLKTLASLRMVTPGAEFRGVTLYNI